MAETAELRILVCAPFGKDAKLIADALESAGMPCHICGDVADLVRELEFGAGAILAVEEALPLGAAKPLADYIARQPAWSDLPVMVLTQPGGNSDWIRGAYERLGNVTLLERPVRGPTLISAARSTLRARQRQYDVCQADRRKDEFLAMLGHELRNPLAPIGAAAQLLALVASAPDKVMRSSEIIARQVAHMRSLIDDLLDVARVTRGLIALDRQAVDVRQILSEAVEQVNPLIRARRHHLLLHLTPIPALVLGDRKRLIQVVTNVLSNACKYTPDGGEIQVQLQVVNNNVVLTVSDNGIGMSPDMVVHAFDLFAQAKRSVDRTQGGLGLGLSLVRSLVESHGGSVQATSNGLGKGSTFAICLPRAQMDAIAADNNEPAVRTIEPRASPLRVMLVDDNVDAANMLEMLLDVSGYDVSVHYTAASALEHAKLAPPQVCLLDIGLPDMEGTELARHLRMLPGTASAVLIAVTGYGQEQDRERTASAGFDHHFVKPVNTAHLLTLLAHLP
jgi:signal transduction histidine kinase